MLNRYLDDYEESIQPEKPFSALLGGFVDSSFQFVVTTNPTLAYVRHLDGFQTTAKHRNRVDLTLDPTDADNQDNPIALYYDEYGELAIWGLDPDQGGALLQSDPTKGAGGVKSVTGSGVDNTDPVNPVIDAAVASGFIQSASVTVANSTAETTLVGAGVGSLALAANTLAVGDEIELEAWGVLSSLAVLPGSLNLKYKWGSVVIASTGAVTLIVSLAAALWHLKVVLAVRSIGASGTVLAQGKAAITNAAADSIEPMSNGTSTITVDTTVSETISLTATFGTADVANTITCTNLRLSKRRAV